VRLAAMGGLSQVGSQEAINYLVTRLHNPETEIRIAVANALGEIGDMHTKAFVSQQLQNETDPKVKEALSKAMARIKDY
jgi:HEAT repeat protein